MPEVVLPTPAPKTLRAHAWWLLLVPAAAGLVLFAAKTVAERRAQDAAMNAELLAPPEESRGLASEDPPAPPVSSEPVAADTGRGATPDPATLSAGTASADGVLSIVPPELVGALLHDSAAVAPSEPPPLDPALFADWSTYEEAVKRSREMSRPVLLAFTAVGCETCESLRASVFDDEAASVTMRSAVIPVAVHDAFAGNGSEARLVDELQLRFGVNTFPTLVVWSPATKRAKSLKGYRGAAATLRFIIDAASAVN